MEDEEGFCIEKTEITTDYRSRFLEKPTERHQQLCEVSNKQPLLARQMSSIRLQYLAHLRNNSLVNQQLREEWAQRTLLYTPRNRIVYHNVQPHLEATYSRSALVFDSQFAGGNLDFAVKVKSREYDLYIRPDTNTTGNFQWFYFRVSNTLQDQSIRFNVRNICRHNPLYEQGFAPYSNSRQEGSIWKMLHPIANRVLTTMEDNGREWCVSFDYTFRSDFDEVEFACQPPYTHENVAKLLAFSPRIGQLCTSLLGLNVPCVTITQAKGRGFHSVGLAIARQHPGEAVGSWMMHGFLHELLFQRDQEVLWIVVPMMNPDGVYVGNSRTGLAGYDYNRLYNQEQPTTVERDRAAPEVVALLALVKKLKKKYANKFKMFIDFHGHSSRQNIFTYGPPYAISGSEEYVSARLFPQLIASRTTLFRVEDCSYNIPRVKRNTARSILFNKFKIPFCYTVESSFGIADGRQITSSDLIEVGKCIAESSTEFLQYLNRKCEAEENSKVLVEKIKLNLTEGHHSEKMESDQEDSSFEEQTASARKILAAKTVEDKDKNITIRNREFALTRHSVYQKHQPPKIRTSEDEQLEDSRREVSHRYHINTESTGLLELMQPEQFSRMGQLGQRTSAKPLKKFVPKLHILSRFERHFRASPRAALMNKTTKNLIPITAADIESTRSVGKPTTAWTSNTTKKSPTKTRNTKPSLLEQLSRNSKNKVGRQMLIINQF